MSERTAPTLQSRWQRLHHDVARQIDALNHGGCAIFAAYLGSALLDLGYEVKVRLVGYAGRDLDNIRSMILAKGGSLGTIANWEREGASFWHVVLDVTDKDGTVYRMDSEFCYPVPDSGPGRHSFAYNTLQKSSLTVAEIAALARKRSGWNTTYDRGQNRPLRGLVKEHFTDLIM